MKTPHDHQTMHEMDGFEAMLAQDDDWKMAVNVLLAVYSAQGGDFKMKMHVKNTQHEEKFLEISVRELSEL